MSRLTRSLSAEARKVRATKLWWILALVIAVYSAMMAAVFVFIFGEMGDMADLGGQSPAFSSQIIANLVYSAVASFGYVVPLLFGALVATGELRHRTLALAFLHEPRRGIVLASKTITVFVVGLALGIAGLLGAIAASLPVFVTTDGDPMLGTGDTWAIFARTIVAMGLWAILGMGVGVLVKNQAFAIVITLVFTQFVEPVARMGAQFWEWSAQVAKFLPGAASDAFVGASLMNNLSALDPSAAGASSASLGIWAGFAVLAAYAAVATLAGWALRWRGDVE
ncbi:ABC-type transport system involved in multi-copper enzyme maturation permease subunit [Leucobacter exalbidus]|uniref:ABC-type transport system involved in multi-copper enzyme maturation permease subunit n=1 Tax=Leucobacter exalbidus TaxID=662960 RepID=A0A940PRL9_9MICO|nr:ABC transporter permease [Leucobacter exalbidus]MBP1326269.1 ABC-type transport system involved in multi-copper enzyme maturation permease subunit [Leucobacter exalbidus]